MGLLDSLVEAAKQQYQTTKRGFGLLASNPQQFAQEATARYFPTKEEEAQFAQAQAAGGDYTQTPYYQKVMNLSQFQGSIKPTGLLNAPQPQVEPVYHGTTPSAAKAIEKSGFDVTKSADGTVWFTSNPNIGEVAASGKGSVIKRMIDSSKMKLGGWAETDKYSTDELIQMGYDGLKLKDGNQITYQIFNPEKLSK
jgi:hypothetical protein